MFKLQNNKDLESVVDAVSALVSSKKIFLDIYETAVNDQPYSFLYIKLKSDINNMFYIRFDKKIIILLYYLIKFIFLVMLDRDLLKKNFLKIKTSSTLSYFKLATNNEKP